MTYLILALCGGIATVFWLHAIYEMKNPVVTQDDADFLAREELADIFANRPNHIVSTADSEYERHKQS